MEVNKSMLYVGNDGSIQLTRGDTARLVIDITNDLTGIDYTISPTDTLRFTVKRTTDDEEAYISKEVIGGSEFDILPEDTNKMSYGKYMYDVELTTAAGDVYTVIVPTSFKILKEVTWHGR